MLGGFAAPQTPAPVGIPQRDQVPFGGPPFALGDTAPQQGWPGSADTGPTRADTAPDLRDTDADTPVSTPPDPFDGGALPGPRVRRPLRMATSWCSLTSASSARSTGRRRGADVVVVLVLVAGPVPSGRRVVLMECSLTEPGRLVRRLGHRSRALMGGVTR